jgi:hypothetical protein
MKIPAKTHLRRSSEQGFFTYLIVFNQEIRVVDVFELVLNFSGR